MDEKDVKILAGDKAIYKVYDIMWKIIQWRRRCLEFERSAWKSSDRIHTFSQETEEMEGECVMAPVLSVEGFRVLKICLLKWPEIISNYQKIVGTRKARHKKGQAERTVVGGERAPPKLFRIPKQLGFLSLWTAKGLLLSLLIHVPTTPRLWVFT